MYTIYVTIILYFFHCFKSIKQKNTIKFKIFLDFPHFSCFLNLLRCVICETIFVKQYSTMRCIAIMLREVE